MRNWLRWALCVGGAVLLFDEATEYLERALRHEPYDPRPWRSRPSELVITNIDAPFGQMIRYRRLAGRWRLLTLWGTPMTSTFSLTEVIDRHPGATIELA